MKKALILHGTGATHSSNWFPWLEDHLEELGYMVLVPDLPNSDHPDIDRYNDFLFTKYHDEINSLSLLIGHSSGAVEVLGLLNDQRFTAKPKACFLVGAFKGNLGWEALQGMDKEFDFSRIRACSEKFIFIHSDNDPFCPVGDASDLCRKVAGKFIELKGQGHFSYESNPKYDKFPKLLRIIKEEIS